MLTATPFTNYPRDIPSILSSELNSNHRLVVFDASKPAGNKKVVRDIALSGLLGGVQSTVAAAADPGIALPTGASFVTVSSANANNIVILPTPQVGLQLILQNGGTGYELRTSAPSTISINGGTGASAESAIAANMTVYLTCISATAWKGYQQAADGTLTAVEAAA